MMPVVMLVFLGFSPFFGFWSVAYAIYLNHKRKKYMNNLSKKQLSVIKIDIFSFSVWALTSYSVYFYCMMSDVAEMLNQNLPIDKFDIFIIILHFLVLIAIYVIRVTYKIKLNESIE